MMISLEGTDESSLSDGTAKLSIRTVIGQFPLLKSIFRLLSKNTKKYLIVHPLWRKFCSTMVSNSDVPVRQAEFSLYIWERRIF